MSEKIFISHGDIILDNIYDGDLNLIKQDGGGSNWNTLYNLAYLGETCYAIGSCGNDEEGKQALSSLQNCGVNTDYVTTNESFTNIMNVIIPTQSKLGDDSVIHSWYSPVTNLRTLHFSENLPLTLPKELENKELYILLDKFELINLTFLERIANCHVCLDIGHYRFIEHFTKQYLTRFFKHANLVQLNNNVLPLLFERLQIKTPTELFELLDLKLLVITKGKKGATFLYRENNIVVSVDKSPELIATVIDSCGAGDAFFASIIKEYAYANQIDSSFINTVFKKANSASREVLGQIGSRRISE